MTTTTLRAPAISCGHCVSTLQRALGKLPGVQRVEGDPAAKQVTVTYDDRSVTQTQIAATMAEEGYPVEA